ncbi:sensor histidine kinase [Halopelagius fulvigenes]|uniref:histidine kinase n=1 Tax=Halopelagius fulvigenes TaxID=1198324 RepID=A0ABD5TVP5_9EURY
MSRLTRFVSAAGGRALLVALSALFVLLAVGRTVLVVANGGTVTTVGVSLLLTTSPWLVVLFGGRWLAETDLSPDLHPRIVGWSLGGFAVMLVVLALVQTVTGGGVDRWMISGILATGLGCAGGFVIGVNEARALARARETERNKDELLRERDLRERIVQTSPVGIEVVDTDGDVLLVNRRAREIVGLTADESGAFADGPLFVETDCEEGPAADSLFERIRSSGEPVYDEERRITCPRGERIHLSVSGSPLYDASGDVASVVFAFEDVTERKRMDEELRETIERLEASNERLERFAYAASHDLQEPLRMVSSYLRLLESRHADEVDGESREFLDYAVDGAERMRAMIDNLLEYSRVGTDGDPLEPTDAGAVLDDVLDDLRPRIEETDATVTSDELPTVAADSRQLAQVFRNLLSNAVTYSGDESPRVHVSAAESGDEWRFSVADEGIGIRPRYHDRVFGVFNRLHTIDEYPGTGIGLALCERIVERHGGDIWVESDAGRGATFYFTLPRTSSARKVRSPGGDGDERADEADARTD